MLDEEAQNLMDGQTQDSKEESKRQDTRDYY